MDQSPVNQSPLCKVKNMTKLELAKFLRNKLPWSLKKSEDRDNDVALRGLPIDVCNGVQVRQGLCSRNWFLLLCKLICSLVCRSCKMLEIACLCQAMSRLWTTFYALWLEWLWTSTCQLWTPLSQDHKCFVLWERLDWGSQPL